MHHNWFKSQNQLLFSHNQFLHYGTTHRSFFAAFILTSKLIIEEFSNMRYYIWIQNSKSILRKKLIWVNFRCQNWLWEKKAHSNMRLLVLGIKLVITFWWNSFVSDQHTRNSLRRSIWYLWYQGSERDAPELHSEASFPPVQLQQNNETMQ